MKPVKNLPPLQNLPPDADGPDADAEGVAAAAAEAAGDAEGAKAFCCSSLNCRIGGHLLVIVAWMLVPKMMNATLASSAARSLESVWM